MFIKSLLRLHSYRKFDYQPRYYDEKKEQRAQRLQERSIRESGSKRISFRNEWRSESKLHSSGGSSLRIAIIAGALLLITYFALRKLNIQLF